MMRAPPLPTLLLLAAAPLCAGGAASLLSESAALLSAGRTGEARLKLQQLVAQSGADPESAIAQVLLGNLDYPRAGFADALETPLTGGDLKAAEKNFTGSLRAFPQGERAPEALFKLGLMKLDRFAPGRNPAEAQGYFETLTKRHPADPFAARARLGLGLLAELRGDDGGALVPLAEAAATAPDGATRALAFFQLGQAEGRMGLFGVALGHLGEAQADPALAPRARALAALARRMLALPGRPWSLDATYHPALPPTVKAISALAARSGALAAADARGGALLVINPAGGLDKNSLVNKPVDVGWLDGQLLVAEEASIKVGDAPAFKPVAKERDGTPRELTRIVAAAPLPGREVALADDRKGVVYRFQAAGGFLGAVFESEGHFDDLAADSLGRFWVLDQRARAVHLVSAEGRLLSTVAGGAPPPGLERPVALAVDGFDHPWVLDERSGKVWIYGVDAKALGAIELPPKTPGKAVAAVALAVDPAGVIHVYDRASRSLLRYQ